MRTRLQRNLCVIWWHLRPCRNGYGATTTNFYCYKELVCWGPSILVSFISVGDGVTVVPATIYWRPIRNCGTDDTRNQSIDIWKWTIHSRQGNLEEVGKDAKDMPYYKMPMALLPFDWPNLWKWFILLETAHHQRRRTNRKSSGLEINVGIDCDGGFSFSSLANMRKVQNRKTEDIRFGRLVE